jgi:hypothetical protein
VTERIGLICGMEWSFPPAFIAKVGEYPGFKAELVRIGGVREEPNPDGDPLNGYRVIVDRMSHEVPFYRFFLKAAVLAGTYVINDPFWWSADDKFFGYSMAKKLGVAVPKTVLLPQKSYIPGVDPQRSLRNLEFPLDWKGICEYVGFPAFLKPADGGGWKNVYKVHDLHELWRAYDETGTLSMTLQEFIDFDEYVRCICIGKDFILPIQYDPKRRCYIEGDDFLPKALRQRVLDDAYAINMALGYDMNSVEFAIKDGVPYAIDFTNPAPDFEINSILPKHFHIVVDQMAKLVVNLAREGRKPGLEYPYRKHLVLPAHERPRYPGK